MQRRAPVTSSRGARPSGRAHTPAGPARSRAAVVVSSLTAEYTDKLSGYKVLVAGATGKTGRLVVETLQDLGVPVRALVRDTSKASSVIAQSPSTIVVSGDVFQFSTLPKAFGDANALIIATGSSDPTNPLGPFNVDFQGTLNLIALARQRGVKKVVLVTSIGTDELLNALNLFWGVLFWKKRAEEELQRSGIDFTIIRPGGLKSELKQGEAEGVIVMKGPGFYGVPPILPRSNAVPAGSILRRQVAEVCVAALVEPAASGKVVEIIASINANPTPLADLFASVE